MTSKIPPEKYYKYLREFKVVVKNYEKEVKEHEIQKRYDKTGKTEYLRQLKGLEILKKAFSYFEKNRKLSPELVIQLKRYPLAILKDELRKYDIFITKKREIKYYEINIWPLEFLVETFE